MLVGAMAPFPSMKAANLLRLLHRLGYEEVRHAGSHRKLIHATRQPISFAFHDRKTVPGGIVKKYLIDRAGLTEEEARALL
jgi:predicted RNA binding protein YcfA (HicA-like mRNA interferase family)